MTSSRRSSPYRMSNITSAIASKPNNAKTSVLSGFQRCRTDLYKALKNGLPSFNDNGRPQCLWGSPEESSCDGLSATTTSNDSGPTPLPVR
jgi:hypothetical protein